MSAEAVTRWLDTIRKNDEFRFQLVRATRELILQTTQGISEEIKYGGILFAKGEAFCGLFSYTEHISLEFSKGAEVPDAHKVLEGKGKGRRHIKLTSIEDLSDKHVKYYVGQAYSLLR